MVLRNCAEVGVREMQRLEYCVAGRDQSAVLARSWASTRATRRREATGLEPAKRQYMYTERTAGKKGRTEGGQETEAGRAASHAHHIVNVVGLGREAAPQLASSKGARTAPADEARGRQQALGSRHDGRRQRCACQWRRREAVELGMEMAPLAPPAVPPPPDFLAGARRAPAASLRHGALEDVCGLPALLCGLAVTCGCAMGPCTRGPGPTPLKAEGATFAPAVATDNGAISCVSGTFDFTNNKRPSSRVLEQKIRQSLLAILALRRSPFLRSSRWGRSLLFHSSSPLSVSCASRTLAVSRQGWYSCGQAAATSHRGLFPEPCLTDPVPAEA